MRLTQSIPFPIDTTLNKALYSNAKCYIKSINIKPTGEKGGGVITPNYRPEYAPYLFGCRDRQ